MRPHSPPLSDPTAQAATDLALAVWRNPLPSQSAVIEAALHEACRRDDISLGDVVQELDDETLIQCIHFNLFRKQVFNELWRRHYPVVVWWFRGWAPDQDTAFDLTQELCLKLFRNLLGACDPRRPKFHFLRFLKRAARNLFLEKYGRRRQPAQLPKDFDTPDRFRDRESPEHRELVRRLAEAIGNLKEPDRTVMRMTADGSAADEISGATDLTLPLVYRIRWRNRCLLAAVLGIPLSPSHRGRPRKSRADR